MTVSREERDAMRDDHYRVDVEDTYGPKVMCGPCGVYWPCEPSRLLDALDEAEQRAQKVRAATIRECIQVAEDELTDTWVDVVVNRLRALDGETPARIAGICTQCGAAECQCGEGT